MILYREEHYAAAADAFRAADKNSDTFLLESVFNLSLSEYRVSRFEEALAAIEQVIDCAPLREALYIKGIILRRLKRLDEAETWLIKSDEAGHENAAAELIDLELARDVETICSGEMQDDPEKRLAYLRARRAPRR